MDKKEMKKSLKQIKRDLKKLRSRDRKLSIFGASSHQYRLNKKQSKAVVESFEERHNAKLPSAYRFFMMLVADGGAGPAYGVLDLKSAYEENPWMNLGPLNSAFAPEEGEAHQGCIMISQRGCGGWTFLVVNGPHRGEVWYDDSVAGAGFHKAAENFLEWYLSWLEYSLAELEEEAPHKESAAALKLQEAVQTCRDTGVVPADLRRGTILQLLEEEAGARNGELMSAIRTLADDAPASLPWFLEQFPIDERLIPSWADAAVRYLQANDLDPALAIYNHLKDIPAPSGSGRQAYLEALNNAIICACMSQDIECAVAIADKAQPYLPENPFISHSAACAYMMAGQEDKALEQCRLAVAFEYDHLEQMSADDDLSPLFENPEFQELFL